MALPGLLAALRGRPESSSRTGWRRDCLQPPRAWSPDPLGAGVGWGPFHGPPDGGCRRHVLGQGPRAVLHSQPLPLGLGVFCRGGGEPVSPSPSVTSRKFRLFHKLSKLGAAGLGSRETGWWGAGVLGPEAVLPHTAPLAPRLSPAPPQASRPSVPGPRLGGYTGGDVLCLQTPFPPGRPPASPATPAAPRATSTTPSHGHSVSGS